MMRARLHKQLWSSAGAMHLEVSLEVKPGELVALFGESGAGKTSILRMLAGLMKPDTGQITVNEDTWFDHESGIDLKPQKRRIGFLFQDYALFPNMTVRQNLEFALHKGQNKNDVNHMLQLMELEALQHQRPHKLSGGQQQRVALARAMVGKPEVLLLDEPLSALDREMRGKLQEHILKVHREFELKTLLVSHDVSEVIKMADRVLVLSEGSITKEGKPAEVFAGTAVSGKFQFTGEVLRLEPQDFLVIVSVLVGNDLVRVVAEQSEVANLKTGDKVLLASKAFNPIIKKIT